MLFVFLLRFYWRFRRQRKLWVAMLSTLIVHVSLYVSVLTYLDRWPAIWYVVTMPLEAMLIFLIFKKVLNIMPDINVRL